jgi:hypothetical protein
MKMIDVTDAELNQIERSTKQPINNREESDAQLIEMVKQIKEGNKIMAPSVQPKIIEPEMPNYNTDVTTFNNRITIKGKVLSGWNRNSWKTNEGIGGQEDFIN